MNTPDNRDLSRATIKLLLENQKLSDKLKKVQKESKQHMNQSEKWQKLWHVEREKYKNSREEAEKVKSMLIALFAKFDLRCACELPANCENPLCSKIFDKAQNLKIEKKSEKYELQSSSDSSSSSDSE